jgi:hypothetical protein
MISSLGILRSVSSWCVSESVIGWCYRVTIDMGRPSLLMCGLMKLRYSTLLLLYSSFSFPRVVAQRIKGHLLKKNMEIWTDLGSEGSRFEHQCCSPSSNQLGWLQQGTSIFLQSSLTVCSVEFFCLQTTLKSLTLPKHSANRFLLVYAAYWHLMSNVCQWRVSPCNFPDWLDSMKTRLQWRPIQLSRWQS